MCRWSAGYHLVRAIYFRDGRIVTPRATSALRTVLNELPSLAAMVRVMSCSAVGLRSGGS